MRDGLVLGSKGLDLASTIRDSTALTVAVRVPQRSSCSWVADNACAASSPLSAANSGHPGRRRRVSGALVVRAVRAWPFYRAGPILGANDEQVNRRIPDDDTEFGDSNLVKAAQGSLEVTAAGRPVASHETHTVCVLRYRHRLGSDEESPTVDDNPVEFIPESFQQLSQSG